MGNRFSLMDVARVTQNFSGHSLDLGLGSRERDREVLSQRVSSFKSMVHHRTYRVVRPTLISRNHFLSSSLSPSRFLSSSQRRRVTFPLFVNFKTLPSEIYDKRKGKGTALLYWSLLFDEKTPWLSRAREILQRKIPGNEWNGIESNG